MISPEYKEGVCGRFKLLTQLLYNRGLVADTKALAAIMDTSVQSISDMTLAKRLPTLEQISKLTDELNVNPNWLINAIEPTFLETNKEEEDIIVMITKGMNQGHIEVSRGEKIIECIRELHQSLAAKDEEILKLNDEVITLLHLVKKI